MEDLKKIGRTIVNLRKESKLTQEDLAGLSNLDRSYLSEIENGRKNMSVKTFIKLSKSLNVKPSSLLEKSNL